MRIFHALQSTIEGLTRTIKLDTNGNRTEFTLDLIELASDGVQKFGTWNSSTGLNITRAPVPKISALADGTLQNKSFIVLTALVSVFGIISRENNRN